MAEAEVTDEATKRGGAAGRARKLRKLAFSVALTVALLEGALWLGHPLSLFPDEWKCEYEQNLPGLKSRVVYERNAQGFRFVPRAGRRGTRKPAGTVRIACLGASTTDLPTQNAADTWWGVLEQRLRERFGPRGLEIEIWARGRGGECASDTLYWAQRGLAAVQPDLVILLQGINDLCYHGGPGYAYAPGAAAAAVAAKEWHAFPVWKKALRRVSQTYRHLARLRHQWRIRSELRRGASLEWHSSALPELRQVRRQRPYGETLARNPDPLAEFEDATRRLLVWLRERGMPCVVLSQPALWKPRMTEAEEGLLWMPVATPAGFARPGLPWLAAELARYNEALRRLAEAEGARFVDAAVAVPRTPEMFFDDCHFTDAGNRVLAEALVEPIAAALEQTRRR